MQTIKRLLIGGLLAALVISGVVAAQPPTPPPVILPSGNVVTYNPDATPNAANVIVIPPTYDNPIDEILSDQTIYTPRPTLDQRSARLPDNFLSAGRTAVVTAGPLNVRSAPNTNAETIVITQLNRGDDVTILALSDTLEWAYIDTRGPRFAQGWVSSLYIEPFDANPAPFADSLPDAPETGFILRAERTVNIRSAPSIFSDRVGILAERDWALIVGRTSTYSWWKIERDGLVGWVSGSYVFPESPAAYNSVPILTEYDD